MSPEKQQIAIAEACGWEVLLDTSGKYRMGRKQGINGGDWAPLPDYLNDLNVMHEVEKILTRRQQFEYSDLIRTLNPEKVDFNWHCPAAQRAEAFLKTINKWEE